MKEKIASLIAKHVPISNKEIISLIEVPPAQELGDFCFPCFTLAKILKKNPNEIASDLSKKIQSKDFEKIESKGPYVNFFVNRKLFAEEILNKILKEKDSYGSSKKTNKKILVEFSQPNTHKAFHIGHVRGTSLGESLARITEFSGNKVIRANYSGDTGMHIAKWIWCYQKFHKKEKLSYDEKWIASVYVDAVKRLEANPDLQDEVNAINQKLDSKEDKKLNAFWKKTKELSVKSWITIYKELNTHFDRYFFESEVEKRAKEIIENLINRKIVKISDGAAIIDFSEHNAPNLQVLVFLRKDGTALYAGKDLALAELKFKEFSPDKSFHVVGKAQELYFHQLLKTFELMKSPWASKSIYVPFSEVRFPEGKMSSRTGDNVLYSDFKKELIDYAKKEIIKRETVSQKELSKRALTVAIAAMKYTMLKQDVNKTIIFDKNEAVKFEGNTGPYLLYTYARAKSILRKAKKSKKKLEIKQMNEKEKSLVLTLAEFPDVVKTAYDSLAPNTIANYAYRLAQAFNEFYQSNQVIGSEEETFRLSLVESFSQVLKNSLNLLGINTLEKM